MSMNRADQGTADDGTIHPDPAVRRRAVQDAIAAQQDRRPRVNANGHPLSYADQSDAYRAAVPKADHERAWGAAPPASHNVYNEPFRIR